MIVSLEPFVRIKATEEEYENLMRILKERRDKGLDPYRWIGNGVIVLFEMIKDSEYEAYEEHVVWRQEDEAER